MSNTLRRDRQPLDVQGFSGAATWTSAGYDTLQAQPMKDSHGLREGEEASPKMKGSRAEREKRQRGSPEEGPFKATASAKDLLHFLDHSTTCSAPSPVWPTSASIAISLIEILPPVTSAPALQDEFILMQHVVDAYHNPEVLDVRRQINVMAMIREWAIQEIKMLNIVSPIHALLRTRWERRSGAPATTGPALIVTASIEGFDVLRLLDAESYGKVIRKDRVAPGHEKIVRTIGNKQTLPLQASWVGIPGMQAICQAQVPPNPTKNPLQFTDPSLDIDQKLVVEVLSQPPPSCPFSKISAFMRSVRRRKSSRRGTPDPLSLPSASLATSSPSTQVATPPPSPGPSIGSSRSRKFRNWITRLWRPSPTVHQLKGDERKPIE
ncbi:hypothetical protein HYDPIDRAFT_32773 [Hydnomerulius pinastri MD-312]|uniref:Uncharacterized protein n=1 Tax=Hydnomerulius pinastri MD-312 TaxID=994086 RepID=A0A0C9V3I9_9AGAM|nr:hypothetical protein HYDPIDRAFT_32773 [Hydnomerulius pinastri MD-312]